MKMEDGANKIMRQSEQLALFSSMQGGLTRAYLTLEHAQAHQQLGTWMQQAGLETWQDSVGNQWGRKVSANPTLATLIIGSHSDTVSNAGKYDGNLGVLLGIEALHALADVELPFHVDVVAFADEEGTRFNTTLIGSSSVAGCFQPDWLKVKDKQDVTMAEALESFGLQANLVGSDARNAQETLAYLEVHIEQGPVLEERDLAVGVVTGIAGAKRYQFTLKGMAGHAGTVPIDMRQDALCGAAEMILAIESYAIQHDVVTTVGKCDVLPGAVNVIPGEATFTLDIRSLKQHILESSTVELLAQLKKIAQRRNLTVQSEQLYQAQAVPCDPKLQKLWAEVVATETGTPAFYLASGAGHDAMVMTQITDIGMLFVRCEKGISHHPREQVLQDDVGVALDCLIGMINKMASEYTK
ncbi:MAG: allantoate deiminase [Psychromonas sp.]|jgi:allantoate deiminase|uniref:allantoate amidohydrolase n=1 Tax=Psychromonas sp. TaxID=1884585 RepID=UPI0039E6BD39